jgi:hypothetical protein
LLKGGGKGRGARDGAMSWGELGKKTCAEDETRSRGKLGKKARAGHVLVLMLPHPCLNHLINFELYLIISLIKKIIMIFII